MNDDIQDNDGVVRKITRKGETVILELAGQIDMHHAVQLRGALLETLDNKPLVTVVDLGGVDFMDSSGLATFVEALNTSRKNGTQLKLVALQERVKSIFEISRLDSLFQIYSSLQEALAE